MDKWGIARPNPSAVCATVALTWEVQVESRILRIQKAWNNRPKLWWGLQQTLALKCIEMRRHHHLPLGPCRCSFWQVVSTAKPAFLPQWRLQKQHMSHEKESSGHERGLKKTEGYFLAPSTTNLQQSLLRKRQPPTFLRTEKILWQFVKRPKA